MAATADNALTNGGNFVMGEMKNEVENVTDEKQYLDLAQKIMNCGSKKEDRTGTGTLSLFGEQMRFSLRDGTLPLLTTKRVFWRGIVEELLWFIKGSTDATELSAKNIHIWDGNSSRQYLDSIGLADRAEGDIGPMYGFQWRHFGAEYKDMHTDYAGKGIDQLQDVINKIKTDPNDRRILMSAWNPIDLPKMALPPCHVLSTFNVTNGEVSCLLYQRSADFGLGVPFNIASYSLLTHMIAHVTGLKPGEFIHSIGDCHIYLNHVEPMQTQIKRPLRPFPTIKFAREINNIDDFKFEDIILENYKPHPKIEMAMSV
ncbi:thymidylate synthase [Lycorma delicatula]|uniref:thymidylate synthase n=1 Tax=Lycorma delicatula TaxID=130591 RepID=UPI003F510A32